MLSKVYSLFPALPHFLAKKVVAMIYRVTCVVQYEVDVFVSHCIFPVGSCSCIVVHFKIDIMYL
jgi:hypothetical protein